MMAQRMLEGEVIETIPSENDAKVRRLEADLRSARLDTEKAQGELRTARESIAALRQQLSPLHRALKAVFGEIDLVGGEDESPSAPQPASAAPRTKRPEVWESWKQKLSGAPAKIIDALLLHNEATVEQLVVLTQITRKQTIYDSISRMNKAGIINKNGGRFSLKEL